MVMVVVGDEVSLEDEHATASPVPTTTGKTPTRTIRPACRARRSRSAHSFSIAALISLSDISLLRVTS